MLEVLQQRANQAVELARGAGANDVFATATRRRSVETRQRDDILERVQEATSSGLRLRLWVDGRYSEHSTSDLQTERLAAFLREAVAMTRALDEDPDRQITDPALYANRSTEDLDLLDRDIRDLSPTARREICEALVTTARAHERAISATGTTNDVHWAAASASSNGFEGQEEGTRLSMTGSVTLRDEGDSRPDGWFRVDATHREDLLEAGEVGRRALARAEARLGSTQGPTLRTTMVVEPQMAGSLIWRLLGPANAQALSQERSYFQGRLGERLFSERLTVNDEPLLSRGLGSQLYDGEGISARSIPLVEGGRVSNIYVDTYYGRKIDMTPTTQGPTNVVVLPGERTMDQLVTEAGQGVLITSWLGGNSDATTGEFSIGIRGHLIENGRIGGPVGEMNASGDLLDLFSHLTAVGSDTWPYSRLRVPTLVFDDVQFSGDSPG